MGQGGAVPCSGAGGSGGGLLEVQCPGPGIDLCLSCVCRSPPPPDPISIAVAVQDYIAPDCRFMTIQRGQVVYVFSKLKGRGRLFWGGSVSGWRRAGDFFGRWPAGWGKRELRNGLPRLRWGISPWWSRSQGHAEGWA